MYCDEHGTADYCGECMTEAKDQEIAALRQHAEALARQLSEVQVPDGWVLAPMYPTLDMVQAGIVAEKEGEANRVRDYVTAIYRAMLKAAPAQPQEQSAPAAGESGKPSWDDAPEWAQWLAQDEDGEWFWYEDKPFLGVSIWNAPFLGKALAAYECEIENPNWRDTLEQRPASPATEESK